MIIVAGGSAADPPHLGHLELIKFLLFKCFIKGEKIDKVIWILSGTRTDKDLVEADHRVVMTSMLFPIGWYNLPDTDFSIKFDDVYITNTSTIDRLEKLRKLHPGADIYWYTGVDSVVPRGKYGGLCEIEAMWDRGDELMQNWKFLILPRAGFVSPHELSLPPQFVVADVELPDISSTEIRERIQKGLPINHLTGDMVAAYVRKHNLYRGEI